MDEKELMLAEPHREFTQRLVKELQDVHEKIDSAYKPFFEQIEQQKYDLQILKDNIYNLNKGFAVKKKLSFLQKVGKCIMFIMEHRFYWQLSISCIIFAWLIGAIVILNRPY